ncbi:MAG: divalent cation tolerance protein CutA, partial [Chrysiogenetes bacterium]|nr:divalent cation tolerance protein CutA [Chrysiogenetes bacterium]
MDISPTEACVALSTTDSEESAREIAHALVVEGLAACVSRLPGATSVYQ